MYLLKYFIPEQVSVLHSVHLQLHFNTMTVKIDVFNQGNKIHVFSFTYYCSENLSH